MKKRKTKGKNSGVTPEQFVKAWQSSGSVSEVVKKLDDKMTHLACSGRATQYRRNGVDLKLFMGGLTGPRIDYKALGALAKKEAK